MNEHHDRWYVRLPDGRTIKAKSTDSVRHHAAAGHIPLNSLVRRHSDEEWLDLIWVAEFADLATGSIGPRTAQGDEAPRPLVAPTRSGVSARLDPMRLQTVGVRGLIDELVAALDSTLTKSKIVPALIAGIVLYLGLFSTRVLTECIWAERHWAGLVAGTAFAVLVLSLANALLAKLTHLELSTMRPARLADALVGFAGYAVPVVVANLVVAGGALGVLFLLNQAPEWLAEPLADVGVGRTGQAVLFGPITIIAAVAVWLVVGLCWLLTPAIVVEESSWTGGIREWRQLLSEHFGRVLVYEGMALMLGIAVSLPLTLAVSLASGHWPSLWPAWPLGVGAGVPWYTGAVEAAVHGLSAGPLLATLAVANVFIYLNLRYESGTGR